MAWLAGGYSKRKPITITGGASGAQTDFQLKLAAVYAAAMQSDFDDLRFTQANGTTLIDAWLESKVNDDSAAVWAEFPTTPANTVEQTYYMYYGNAGAASDWDGAATFLQYQGSTAADFKLGNVAGSSDTRMRVKYTKGATAYEYIAASNTAGLTTDDSMYMGLNPAYIAACTSFNEGSYTQQVAAGSGATTNIYDFLLDVGTNIKFYRDDVLLKTFTTHLPNENMGMKLQGIGAGGEWVWGFLAKYALNPPTYAFGAEESEPVGGVAPTSIFYGPFVGPLGGAI